ncbi:MAG: hypothetical protein ACPGYV_07205 [Phycisphaeraceae bacterium]
MAKVRGGNTGFAVALVIFGCGFVIALLVAIIFYTKIETHKVNQEAAEKALAEYISNAETAQSSDYKAEGATVFGNMLIEIRNLQTDLREANDQIAKLTRETGEMEDVYNTLAGQKNAVDAELAAERQQFQTTMQERKDIVDKAIREKAELQTQINALQDKVTVAIENADEAARERIAELSEAKGTLESEIFDLKSALASARVERDNAIDALPKPPAPNTTSPDGEVASVFDGGDDLFISLGRRNSVVLGMTFEVFDPQPVIRLNTVGEARGKATIEVYGLKDDSATCRVVRRNRGANILPGDPVVNIAFDPNIDITMYAFGFFDIEGDGGTNDISRINALILENGAELGDVAKDEGGIPILTPDLNYIILGARPELPEKPSPDEFDPVVIAEYQAQVAANEAYFRIVDEAKLLRIPVLNQDRFLQLIGYYER